MRIYMIEDDREICENLTLLLGQYGYEAVCCENENLKNVVEDVKSFSPDLILLDILLPYKDGFTICRELRNELDTPIIMLTGQNSEMEEIISLKSGADDFVGKPYHPQVLLAHIEAVLKRTAPAAVRNEITVENITLDRTAGILYCRTDQATDHAGGQSKGQTGQAADHAGGQSKGRTGQAADHAGGQNTDRTEIRLELSRNELRILNLLMGRRGKIVSRDEIMEELWRDGRFVDENTLNVNMVRLRKRLEEAGIKDFIKTRRGMGYQI